MPGFDTHETVGGFVGGTAALWCSQGQPPLLALAETLGGVLAGRAAGVWPDAFEPATSSYHRDTCHALAPAAYGATVVFGQVESVQGSLRAQAQACFKLAAATNDGNQRFIIVLTGFALHALAGAVPAVPASYISHIALDACTPRGVPLLRRGF
jgi:hypothetical protein